MKNLTFECSLHELKYEYPRDWLEQKISSPECPLCVDAELSRLSAKYIEVKQQRDKLLEAINIKLSVETNSF